MKSDSVRDYWEQRFARGVSLGTVGWLGLGESFNTWMYRVRASTFRRLMRRFAPHPSRVLDIGSGTGFYLDRWGEIGAKSITASDLTAAATTLLTRRGDVNVVQLDIGDDNIPLHDRFDAISAMDVLFHIVDDERYNRAIQNVASLLNPGGLFVFTDNFLHKSEARTVHQTSRRLSAIMSTLGSAGFTVLERRPAFVLMNTPIDSGSRALQIYWSLLQRVARSNDLAANTAGALLYFPELLLTTALHEGPSTEIAVCKLTHQHTLNE
jgi:SAM-dependent methyltransferase